MYPHGLQPIFFISDVGDEFDIAMQGLADYVCHHVGNILGQKACHLKQQTQTMVQFSQNSNNCYLFVKSEGRDDVFDLIDFHLVVCV